MSHIVTLVYLLCGANRGGNLRLTVNKNWMIRGNLNSQSPLHLYRWSQYVVVSMFFFDIDISFNPLAAGPDYIRFSFVLLPIRYTTF